jgi:hypothetical protein
MQVKNIFHTFRLRPNLEGIPPTHLFNYDESPVKDDPGAEEAFFAQGTKYHEQVMNHSKVSYSLMFCCSAAGQMLPPMVVYQSGTGSVYTSWTLDGPEGATYAASKSGWFDMSKFNQWFTQVTYFSKQGPTVPHVTYHIKRNSFWYGTVPYF